MVSGLAASLRDVIFPDIDAIGAEVEKSGDMKRMHPLLIAIISLLIFARGLNWQMDRAAGCAGRNGIVVGAMTRSQHCGGDDYKLHFGPSLDR